MEHISKIIISISLKSIKLVKHYKKAIPLFFLGLVFITSFNSCSNKCNCSNWATSSLRRNDTAVFYVDNSVHIRKPDSLFVFILCNPNFLPNDISNGDSVLISGEVKDEHCGGQLNFRGPFIKLTSIKKLN